MKKRLMSFLLAFALLIGQGSGQMLRLTSSEPSYEVQAASADYVEYTEAEAYEKGLDFYKAWYIMNRGHFHRIYTDYSTPYRSAVIRLRNDVGYRFKVKEWQLLTLDIQNLFNSSSKANAYTEAMLFNMLYDEKTNSLTSSLSFIDSGSDVLKAIDDEADLLGLSAYSKLMKQDPFISSFDHTFETQKQLEAFIDQAKSTSELYSAGEVVGDIVKIFDLADTAGDIVKKMAKVRLLAGTGEDKALILDRMSRNAKKYMQVPIDSFASVLRNSNKSAASGIVGGEMINRVVWDKVVDGVWKSIQKTCKLETLTAASSVGKFVADSLTNTSDQFGKFHELCTYYDVDQLLCDAVYMYSKGVQDGNEDSARIFTTGYKMMQNSFDVCMDCYRRYLDALYKEGLINMLFPTINKEKYDQKLEEMETMRQEIDSMIEGDLVNAEKAYYRYAEEMNPIEGVIVDLREVDLTETDAYFDAHKLDFGFDVNSNVHLAQDAEIYGNVTINSNSLYLDGNTLTVYGDLYVYGAFDITGHLDVKGSVYQEASVRLSSGHMTVGENYYVRGGDCGLWNHSDLTIQGNFEGPESGSGNNQCLMMGGSTLNVHGDMNCIAMRTYTYSEGYVINAWGNITLMAERLIGDSCITLKGDADVTAANVYGADLVIENAASRKITLSGVMNGDFLTAKGLPEGTPLTLYADNLTTFSYTLNNDVNLEGSVGVYNELDLNGYSMTVHGDMIHTDGILTVGSGCLEITGDYRTYDDPDDSGFSHSRISMIDESGHMIVRGNVCMKTYYDQTLKKGLLEIGGDFTIKDEGYTTFEPEKDFLVRLNGTELQRITFEDGSRFSKLELTQYPENYIFTPDECWDECWFHCDHSDTVVRDKMKATCVENGYTGDEYCRICDKLLTKGSVIAAKGHKSVTVPGVQPTCTEDGHTSSRYCSVCGKIFLAEEELQALGHEDEVTCQIDEATGTTITIDEPDRICDRCGANLCEHEETEEIPAVPKTCTKDGMTQGSRCLYCGEIVEEPQVVAAIGHVYGSWTTTKAATVFATGTKQRSCKNCSATEKKTLAKLDPAIKLSATSKTISKGKYFTLTVSGLAKGDSIASVRSSRKTVATVTKISTYKYKIKGVKKGSATITVTLKSGKKKTCKVTVK